MLSKTELKDTFIKYDSSITEEIFYKVYDKIKTLFPKYKENFFKGNQRSWKDFKNISDGGYLFIREGENKTFGVSNHRWGSVKQIQVSDILGEEVNSSKPEFIVGKWYLRDTGTYVKLLKLEYDVFVASEYIQGSTYNKKKGKFGDVTCKSNGYKLLEDLSEIQQYLPDGHEAKIVKEFVLPEKWCISCGNKLHFKDLNTWRKTTSFGSYGGSKGYLDYKGIYSSIRQYTEITFEQFKKHVLKSDVKEEPKPIEKWSAGSYVVYKNNYYEPQFPKGSIHQIIKDTNGRFSTDKVGNISYRSFYADQLKWFATKAEAGEFAASLVKPTVEALEENCYYKVTDKSGFWMIGKVDIGNDTKESDEYDLRGTYHYCIDSDKIFHKTGSWAFKALNNTRGYQKLSEDSDEVKWLEACNKAGKYLSKEDALKTKKDVKQKQVVHCTSKEEYVFAAKKCEPGTAMYKCEDFEESSESYPEGIAISISENSYCGLNYWKNHNYQILSFQEWCDLNNYTFNSKEEYKVGDYIILENAGGWGYSPCNNGCLGKITKLTRNQSHIERKELIDYVTDVAGDLLNSNNTDVDFSYIPVATYEGKTIVRKATQAEINVVVKPKEKPFVFNRWYKHNSAKTLLYVKEGYKCYGFTAQKEWEENWQLKHSDFNRFTLASEEDVKQRLLEYAKDKYPIGTKFNSLTGDNHIVDEYNINLNENVRTICDSCSTIFSQKSGNWAETISKSETKVGEVINRETISSKPNNEVIQTEFNRNFYVKVNSQEEANQMFGYLESIGEKIGGDFDRRYSNTWKYVVYGSSESHWMCNGVIGNKEERFLSDFPENFRGNQPEGYILGFDPAVDSIFPHFVKETSIKYPLLEEEKEPLIEIPKKKEKVAVKPNYSLL